ncbi:regulator of G-protein signaling 13 isoform 2-T3 [Liasis olivaceus]
MNRSICWLCSLFRDGTNTVISKISLEEVLLWSQSFEKLMATKYGPIVYKSYLKTEYSDENMEFWLACERYKKILSQRKRISEAQKLFKEYIQPQAPKEINIDSPVREGITMKIQEPTQSCFDEAQKIVYLHMERDSYPRFLSSEIYQSLIFTLSAQQQSPHFLPSASYSINGQKLYRHSTSHPAIKPFSLP